MKKLLLSCMFVFGIGASAQILVSEGFEGSSLPSGWASTVTGTGTTTGPGGYGTSAGPACVGSKTVYKNIYETTYTGWNMTYTSTASNATALNYSFKYLAKGYGTSGAITGSVSADYSVDGGTNWVTLLTPVVLDSPNATPIPCTTVSGTIPAGTIAAGANFKFRLKSTSNPTGDFYMGFDDVQLSQTITSAPACTTISAPANAATGISITPTINWAVAGGATSYTLNVGTTAGGTDIINGLDVGNVTSYTIPAATSLAYSTQYYATIIPKNGIGSATGCTGNSFTTIAMPCPSVSAPSNSATGVSTIPTFVWGSVSGATGYKITVGTTSGGTDILNNIDLGNVNSYTVSTALSASTVYYYTITSYNAATNSGTCTVRSFTTTAATPPANDNCGNATALTVNTDLACGAVTAGNTLGASLSMAATPCNGNPDDDVWYSFVATGPVHVVTLSSVVSTGTTSTTDMYFQVLSGACGSQTSVLCSDPNSAVVSGLTAGQTYYVRVYTYSGAGYNASFNICVGTPLPPPSNDECSGAISLTVNPDLSCGAVTAGNTISATQSMSAGVCSGTPDDDIWYSFVATATSHVVSLSNVVSTGSSSSTDMYFQVLSGTCGSLTSVLCSDDNSKTVTGLTAGQTYYVRVYTYSGTGYNASFNICVGTLPPPPANDICTGAVALTVGTDFASGVLVTSNGGATNDGTAGCITTASNINNNVWYSVVVPASGNVVIETAAATGSSFVDSVMEVYSGSCGSFTSLGCNDDINGASNRFSKVTLTGQVPGSTIYASVWKYSANANNLDGQFQISAYDSSALATSEVSNTKNSLKVYPNPFADVLNISDISKVKSISVSDVAGRLVKTIINPSSVLQLGELKSGMYLVVLEMKDGSKQTIKTIKK